MQKDKLNKAKIKSNDKNTKVFRIHHTKLRHTFSRLVHISVKQLSSMHVLLLLQNLIELFNESTIKRITTNIELGTNHPLYP